MLTWEITIRDDLDSVCDENAQIIYAGHETVKCQQAKWHDSNNVNCFVFDVVQTSTAKYRLLNLTVLNILTFYTLK